VEVIMKTLNIPMPLLKTLVVTRGLLGIGIGLLVSDKLARKTRFGLGWALFGVGALSTIPIAMKIFAKRNQVPNGRTKTEFVDRDASMAH
jgi:hypothetical protein